MPRIHNRDAFMAKSTSLRTNIEKNIRRVYGHETEAQIRACVADTMRAIAANRSQGV